MSACDGCWFHRGGYMWNACEYFQAECYHEPEKCLAFTIDGVLSEDAKAKIADAFGTAKDIRQEADVNENDTPF